MSPEQLKHLLQRYAETWALVDSQERTYGHAGTDNLARKSALESEILSLFVEAEEGARRERTEWMDIETAPKDGRRFLLYPADGFGETPSSVGYWDRDPEEECGQCWRYDDGERIEPVPTHWQPLPSPPDEAIRAKVELEE